MVDKKHYIKAQAFRHIQRRQDMGLKADIILSDNMVDLIFAFEDEHLKDSHALSDLVYTIVDILNE